MTNMTVFTSATAYTLSIGDTHGLPNKLSATLLSRQDQFLVYAAHVHLVLQLDHRRTGVMPVDAVPTRALHGRDKGVCRTGRDVVPRTVPGGGALCPGPLQLLQSGLQVSPHILHLLPQPRRRNIAVGDNVPFHPRPCSHFGSAGHEKGGARARRGHRIGEPVDRRFSNRVERNGQIAPRHPFIPSTSTCNLAS